MTISDWLGFPPQPGERLVQRGGARRQRHHHHRRAQQPSGRRGTAYRSRHPAHPREKRFRRPPGHAARLHRRRRFAHRHRRHRPQPRRHRQRLPHRRGRPHPRRQDLSRRRARRRLTGKNRARAEPGGAGGAARERGYLRQAVEAVPRKAETAMTLLSNAASLITLAALATAVHSQTFPSKPLRIIVPFAPGGAADVTSRLLGEHMAKGLGQPVIAENRPGAGAVIGYELAARAAGDGYTLLVVFPSFVINPSVKQGLKYAPLTDFKAVGQTISLPMAFAVNPSVPAKSLQELAALARAKPGEIAYGTPGAGTTHHVIGEMFRLTANIDIVHAPFQGEIPALTASAGGHLPMVFVNASAVAPFAKSGKMRALAVTTPERAEVLPEVQTMREAGYPEIESTNWSGLVVPAATPG